MTYPLSWIREQFPALATDTVFLDNAAGAQVPGRTIVEVVEAMTTMNVNKGGAYRPSRQVTLAKERVRERTATFLNAADPKQVVFGPNATTLVTLLAQSFGGLLRDGDEIVVSGLDHHANIDPWRALEARGVRVRCWQPRAPAQTLDPDDLRALLGNRTRLVAMTAASNALGTLTPVSVAAELAHAAGAWLMVDAVHYAPHRLPDVDAFGADLLVFSPYKVFGPHLGVLYLGEELLDTLPGHPLAFFPPADPIAWEPGTQNHEAILGFGGTLDYLDELGLRLGASESGREALERAYQAITLHERALCARLLDGLDVLAVERFGLPGPDGRTATVSLLVDGLGAQELANGLAERNLAVAAGHYYAYELMMERLGLAERGGAVRVSLLHYSSADEVDALLAGVGELAGAR